MRLFDFVEPIFSCCFATAVASLCALNEHTQPVVWVGEIVGKSFALFEFHSTQCVPRFGPPFVGSMTRIICNEGQLFAGMLGVVGSLLLIFPLSSVPQTTKTSNK